MDQKFEELFGQIFGKGEQVPVDEMPTIGFVAWVKQDKPEGLIRFLKLKADFEFPDNITWVDLAGDAEVFLDGGRAALLFDQMVKLPNRHYMGREFPALPLVIGLQPEHSEPGEFKGMFGISPLVVMPASYKRGFLLTIKEHKTNETPTPGDPSDDDRRPCSSC